MIVSYLYRIFVEEKIVKVHYLNRGVVSFARPTVSPVLVTCIKKLDSVLLVYTKIKMLSALAHGPSRVGKNKLCLSIYQLSKVCIDKGNNFIAFCLLFFPLSYR